MSASTLDSFTAENATIDVAVGADQALRLKFSGTIDQPNPGVFLDPFLEKVHAQALGTPGAEVTADFTALSFLNSCGIKSLIKWIMKQTELPEEKRYPIKLLYSRQVTWQQTTLKALTYLAKGVVTVEPV